MLEADFEMYTKENMNGEKFPLVSICIPTYQGEKYLLDALYSAANQTYQNIEIVVSDDASTDKTLSILNEFKNKVSIPMKIYHHTPQGIGANWNNCIKYANGSYIKFLFQDDILMPNCVEEMIKVFESFEKVGLVASKRDILIEDSINNIQISNWLVKFSDLQSEFTNNQESIVLNEHTFNSKTFYNVPFNKIGEPTCVMFQKSIINKVGLFRNDLKQVLDYEYWYRIMAISNIVVIPKPLVKFRIHPKQETQKNKKRPINDYEIYQKILYENYFDLLHPSLKENLIKKYSFKYQLAKKINKWKQKIKRLVYKFVS